MSILLLAAAAALAGVDVSIPGPRGPLGGTLTDPARHAPALILIPGSGPTDRNGDKAGSAKGRCAEEGLYGREQSHQERRVVVPPGIEMTLPHPPGARDDARLIRVEDRERQSVTAADETEEGGEHEDHREGDPRIQ